MSGLEPTHLLRVVGLGAARRLEGRFWRAFDGANPLDTSGTRLSGGRYNPRWEFEALYGSWSRELCLRDRDGDREDARAHVAALDVQLEQVLDLSNPFVRMSFLLREEDLTGDEWELTGRIGRVARDAGFEALLVPTNHGGRSIVVFLDRLGPRSYVTAAEQVDQGAQEASPRRRTTRPTSSHATDRTAQLGTPQEAQLGTS